MQHAACNAFFSHDRIRLNALLIILWMRIYRQLALHRLFAASGGERLGISHLDFSNQLVMSGVWRHFSAAPGGGMHLAFLLPSGGMHSNHSRWAQHVMTGSVGATELLHSASLIC